MRKPRTNPERTTTYNQEIKNMTKEQRDAFIKEREEELHRRNDAVRKVRNNRENLEIIDSDDRLLTTQGFYDIPYHVDLYWIT